MKSGYFDQKNLSKPLDKTKTYDEVSDIYRFYKNGTRYNQQDFADLEGNDDEDFQNPLKLSKSQININDYSSILYKFKYFK